MITNYGKQLAIRFQRYSLFVLLSVCLFGISLPGNGQNTASQPAPAMDEATYERAREELATAFRLIKKARAELDESSFEPGAKAKLLQGSAEAIFEYVRDEIAFQPYAGVMRRAEGTLMSRAGNAYDQSLLLASMLDASGIETRYVTATLSVELARKHFILQTPPPPIPAVSPSHLSALIPAGAEFEDMAQNRANLETIAMGYLTEGYWHDYQVIDRHLSQSPHDPRRASTPTSFDWVPNILKHCWIQARVGGRWVDLDPSALNLQMGEALATPTDTSDFLDADALTFKLKVRMELETNKLDQEPIVVMDQSVNLMETLNHIRIAAMPENITGVESLQEPGFFDAMEVFRAALEINGTTLPGSLFNLAGELLSDDENVRNATEMRDTQSQGFGALNSSMGGLFGDPAPQVEPETHIERVWVRFDIVSPGGEVRTQRRLWAERGTGRDEAANLLALKMDLLSTAELLSSATDISPAYVVASQLDQLLASKPAMFTLLALEAGRPPPNLNETLDSRITIPPQDLFDLHVSRATMFSDMARRDFPSWSTWTDGPFLVMERKGAGYDSAGELMLWEALDVLHNAVTAMPYQVEAEAGASERAELLLRQGIIDTQLEFQALGGGEIINAHSVTRAAVQAGIDLDWIAPADTEAVNSLPISVEDRAAILRDIEAGYAVLAPRESVMLGAEPQMAWWRLYPETGEILGMADRGAGATYAEYKTGVKGSLEMGWKFCLLIQAVTVGWNQDAGWSNVGEFAKCMVWSAVGGAGGAYFQLGRQTTWVGHLKTSGLLNAVMCALSQALSNLGSVVEPVQTYIAGTTIEDAGGEGTARVAQAGGAQSGGAVSQAARYAGCVATGVAIGAAGYRLGGGTQGAMDRERARLAEQLSRPVRNTPTQDFGRQYQYTPSSGSGASAPAAAQAGSGAAASTIPPNINVQPRAPATGPAVEPPPTQNANPLARGTPASAAAEPPPAQNVAAPQTPPGSARSPVIEHAPASPPPPPAGGQSAGAVEQAPKNWTRDMQGEFFGSQQAREAAKDNIDDFARMFQDRYFTR